MVDPIRELFDSIDAARLAEFTDRRRPEDLHLEFKTAARRGEGDELGDDDRRNLARAISGFANADGGVLVWGIECKRIKGIDAAAELELCPLKNVARTLSDLASLTHQVVNPSVAGVEHRAIEIGEGRGFVLTLVPASDGGPHMAKLGEDRYYRRSGDSFRKMEHFEIADMFGRRARPLLTLSMCRYRMSLNDRARWYRLTIRNDGRALARYVRLLAKFPKGTIHFEKTVAAPSSLGRSTQWSDVASGCDSIDFVDNEGVYHVGAPYHAIETHFTIMGSIQGEPMFKWELHAEGMVAQHGEMHEKDIDELQYERPDPARVR